MRERKLEGFIFIFLILISQFAIFRILFAKAEVHVGWVDRYSFVRDMGMVLALGWEIAREVKIGKDRSIQEKKHNKHA